LYFRGALLRSGVVDGRGHSIRPVGIGTVRAHEDRSRVLFQADDGVRGAELWRSDGTADGTVRLKDVNPGPGSSFPGLLTSIQGVLFFSADDGTTGFEPWRSDGTRAGTRRIADVFDGPSGSYPENFVRAPNGVLFGPSHPTFGREPWRTPLP
jgi:trimeric autotransporter adhesin